MSEFTYKREEALYRAPLLMTTPEILGWVKLLAEDRDYVSLAAILTLTVYEGIAPLALQRMQDAAHEALVRAGEEAVHDILHALEEASRGRDRLAKVLLGIGSGESVAVLHRYLYRREFCGDDGLNDRVFCFVHGGRSQREVILGIVESEVPAGNMRGQIESALTAAGWISSSSSMIYCDCGYPTRVKYGDGSVGPIRSILDEARVEDFVKELRCPQCRREVARIEL